MKKFNSVVAWQLVFFLICFSIESDSIECGDKACPMYSFCNPDTNNCTCNTEVLKSPIEPQCGSDGKTYPSLQALQKHACGTNQIIYPSKKGQCYNCSDAKCHHYTSCDKDLNVCFCKPVLEIYSPVCGSDGKTYDSIYQLNHTACMEERDIVQLHSGSCKERCGGKLCHEFASCNDNTNKCECNLTSNNIFSPSVCGSNGVTYKNMETLKYQSCISNLDVKVKQDGDCPQAECGGKKCHSFASCNNNTNTCECTKVSNDTISQVCGNDGITYNNEENLMYKSCISTNFDVRKKHDGKCSRGEDRLMIYILLGVGAFVLFMLVLLTVIWCIQRRKDYKPPKIEYPMNDYEAPLM